MLAAYALALAHCLARAAAHRAIVDGLSSSGLPLCEAPSKKVKVPKELSVMSLGSLSEQEVQERSATIAAMRGKIDRPFTAEEVSAARIQSGFGRMACGQQEPVAVFILGPPSAGKSTANVEKLKGLGMPFNDAGEPLAATLDGDVWRDYHADYQNLVQWGLEQSPPCMFMDAADILKSYTKPMKYGIYADVVKGKCNIIIPETCSSVDRCVAQATELKSSGYKVHVIGVVGPREKIFSRGRGRQDKTGRWYNTATFDKCVTAIVPMLAMGNGHCELIDNSADWPPAGTGPATLFPSACPNMPLFGDADLEAIKAGKQPTHTDAKTGATDLVAVRTTIMAVSGTSKEKFEKDEYRQLGLISALQA